MRTIMIAAIAATAISGSALAAAPEFITSRTVQQKLSLSKVEPWMRLHLCPLLRIFGAREKTPGLYCLRMLKTSKRSHVTSNCGAAI